MREVGGHAVRQQVLRVEGTQLIICHPAGIKGLAAQLRQGHHSIAGRAATGAPGFGTVQVPQQLRASWRINQRHMPLVHPHGLELIVRDFVFRVDQGVADGVEVVAGHGLGADRLRKIMSKDRGCSVASANRRDANWVVILSYLKISITTLCCTHHSPQMRKRLMLP